MVSEDRVGLVDHRLRGLRHQWIDHRFFYGFLAAMAQITDGRGLVLSGMVV